MARIAKFLTIVAKSTKSFPPSFNLCLKDVRQIDGKCLSRMNIRVLWKTKVDFIQHPSIINIYVESKENLVWERRKVSEFEKSI